MRKVAQFLFLFTVTFLLTTAAFTATVKKKPHPAPKQLELPCWYGLLLPPPKEGARPVCGRMVYWI